MWQVLVSTTSQLLEEMQGTLRRVRGGEPQRRPVVGGSVPYHPLQRVVLTDGVGRTLFQEFAEHRSSTRGEEETGWVLLGLREAHQAIALATLPAGAERNAGVAHVRFNSIGQALGSRIVRQTDRRLTILGVVHTHPGSLRHPSDADYRGDSRWVGQLRGGEGIFAIGTADGHADNDPLLARQPKPHLQCWGKLCFSWYALKDGDASYRPLPVAMTLGPDLARPLHTVWSTIEKHAERLDRLAQQQKGVRFDVVPGRSGEMLVVTIPLAEPYDALRVLLEEDAVHYFLLRDGDILAADPREQRVDQGVYLLLAELASHM
ncbi:MAG: Mov34/MPN/PAD-1 family protein [Gemmataceae bacterium]